MLPILLALLISPNAFAAVSSTTSPAIPFYRSVQSLFASGQASREVLESSLNRTEFEVRYKASWNNKTYSLKGTSLLRDIQLSKVVITKSNVEVLAERKSNSKALQALSKDTSLTLLDSDEYWALVQNPKNTLTGYIPLHLLQSKNEDRGYYINLIDTYLRKSTKIGSEIITTIPRMTRLEIKSIQHGWLEIAYQNHTGFADINHFVSRADFASLAYHPKLHWLTVTHRDNDFLVTTKGQRVPIKELWGMVTNSKRAVLSDNTTTEGPPLRAQVEIIQPDAHIWGVSQLEDHGEVWWQKSTLALGDKEITTKPENEITTDQLIKRKIYSIAFVSKNSLQGLASANGIYSTEDGIKWKALPQFTEQNFPVSIHPDGAWFVGSYRSNDKGHSFDPFIRWDILAQAIESSTHRSPKILRITKIESLPRSQIQIQIDTGVQSIKLRSHLLGERWEVIKN